MKKEGKKGKEEEERSFGEEPRGTFFFSNIRKNDVFPKTKQNNLVPCHHMTTMVHHHLSKWPTSPLSSSAPCLRSDKFFLLSFFVCSQRLFPLFLPFLFGSIDLVASKEKDFVLKKPLSLKESCDYTRKKKKKKEERSKKQEARRMVPEVIGGFIAFAIIVLVSHSPAASLTSVCTMWWII